MRWKALELPEKLCESWNNQIFKEKHLLVPQAPKSIRKETEDMGAAKQPGLATACERHF